MIQENYGRFKNVLFNSPLTKTLASSECLVAFR